MEIKYAKFNKWMELGEHLDQFDPRYIIGEDNLLTYINGTKPDLSEEDNLRIEEESIVMYRTLDSGKMHTEIEEEIDFNVANITTADQVKRYLTYLKKRLDLIIDIAEDTLCCEFLKSGPIDYDATEFYRTMPLDNGSEHPVFRIIHTDAISKYISACVHTTSSYDELRDYIEEILNPSDLPISLEHELTKNTHRLLLLHKAGVFKTLIDLHYEQIGASRFAKLIATILGIPESSFNGFRGEVGKLVSEIHEPGRKKAVQTPGADKSVNAYLAELGIL